MSEILTPIEILPHPLRGTMEIGSERIMPVRCEIRAADGATDEKPIITITGTDGSEDRHGTPIEAKGWDFSPYRSHPVALWQHGEVKNWPYVGITNDLRSGGGSKWDFSIELLTNQWRHLDVNMPLFLWETYRDFNVAALSVAFIPKTWEPYEATGIPSFFAEGVRYKTQELTEVSFVNVPSNRNATAKTFEKWRGMGRGEGLARMLGYEVSPIVIRSQPEERMSVPKDKAPESRADEPKALTPELIERISNGDALSAEEETLLAGASDELRSLRTAAIAAKSAPKAVVLPTLSADVLRKKAAGETLTRDEQASVDAFTRSLVDLGIAIEPPKETPSSALRAVLRESVTALRCGDYYDDYYDPSNYCPMCGMRLGQCNDAETVSQEDAAAEQATISALIVAKTQQLSAALTGWSTAEHDALRSFCSDDVYNAMWRTEKLWSFAEYWYDDLIPAAETPAGMPDMMRKFTKAVLKDPAALKRAGAQFSAKNKQLIQAIHDHATEIATSCATMLTNSADDTTTEKSVGDSQVIRISGLPSPDRDEGEGQSKRSSVADGPDAGAGDRSKNSGPAAPLYDATALPVRR